MEIRVLRYFLTVCREENISKAAEALYITQPTLSRQLMELEEELGTTLFVRGKRKIALTEDGMLLRRRAEELIELQDKIVGEYKNQFGELSGVISIGAAETKAFEIIPKAIESFRKKNPLVTFDIHSDIATNVKERLDRGIADIGLLVEPGDIDKYDFIRLNTADKCGILMSVKSPLASQKSVTVDDLIGLPVVANKRESIRQFYRSALGQKYDQLNVIATFNLINNAAYFAEDNIGYVFTIEGTLRNQNSDKICFKPFSPEIAQSSFIIWKKFQPMRKVVKCFIDEITMLIEHNKQ